MFIHFPLVFIIQIGILMVIFPSFIKFSHMKNGGSNGPRSKPLSSSSWPSGGGREPCLAGGTSMNMVI